MTQPKPGDLFTVFYAPCGHAYMIIPKEKGTYRIGVETQKGNGFQTAPIEDFDGLKFWPCGDGKCLALAQPATDSVQCP